MDYKRRASSQMSTVASTSPGSNRHESLNDIIDQHAITSPSLKVRIRQIWYKYSACSLVTLFVTENNQYHVLKKDPKKRLCNSENIINRILEMIYLIMLFKILPLTN